MTEPQAASSTPGRLRKGPRLARKGLAVPAGQPGLADQPGLPDQPGLTEPDGASSARPGAEPEAEMHREASTGASAPLPAGAAAPIPNPAAARGREAETAPAASLRPFDFLGARGPSFDAARLPQAEPEVTFEPSAAPLAEPPAQAPARPEPGAAPATSATPAKSDTPRVDPSWRIGHDPKPARPGRGRARLALAATLAVAAVLGLGWQAHRTGWLDFAAGTAARVEAPNETAAPGAPTREAPGAAPPIPEKMVGEKMVPETPVETAATSAPVPDPTPEAAPPSIDVVRVEPDGAAVIAGRAAPGAELIVLDNGTPIGTATADIFGEWVFIPDAPLPTGAHEFGLVVKRVQGGVTLPAAGEAGAAGDESPAGSAPAPREVERGEAGRGHDARATGSERGPAAQAPVPTRKPAVAGAAAQENGGGVRPGASGADLPGTDFPGAGFVVQLASVKTRAGAEREWRALRRRFPKLLADMRLSLDEAKLAGGVTVLRLRTGAFADARAAAALCKRLAAARQDCLVVRAAVGG